MGRTTAASRSRSVDRPAVAEEPVGLELVGVGLCLGAVLLAAALATLAPEHATGTFRNVVGNMGRAVAGALTRAVGIGAWLVPVFGLAWGYACLRGRRPRWWGRRALLLPVAAAIVGAEAALLLGTRTLPGLVRSGPGGYVGVALATSLFQVFGRAAGIVGIVAFFGMLRLMVDVPLRRMIGSVLSGLDRATGRTAVADPEADVEDDDEEEYEEEEEYEDEEEDEGAELEAEDAEAGDLEGEGEEAVALSRSAALKAATRRRAPRRARARKKPTGTYVFPPTTLLDVGQAHDPEVVREEVEANGKVLGDALASFGVEAKVVSSQRGPVITFFEIAIGSGVRLNRVTALADDLAIALKAPSVRIVAPIPGRSTVGVEVPNLTRETVVLRDLIEEASGIAERKSLPIYLGRDTAGRPLIEDLSNMPHILVAGATGSGKSVCINSIILSILYARTPEEVSLILIDPKQVELSFFEGIPHLITPVVTDMKRAAKILQWAVDRMEERYGMLLAAGVRNTGAYNAVPKAKLAEIRERTGKTEESFPDHLPHVVLVVDELADLMMTNGKEVELAITRLAQKSRAVGIHIILATQRPSTNVITGLIKANMPTRIAFCVSSKIDSRVILDANGADKLLGMGDMLYMHPRSLHLRRAQGTLVTDAEARAVVDYLAEHCPTPEYQDLLQQAKDGLTDPLEEDELYDDAVRAVLSTKLGSASMLQRRMSIGYTRASRLIDMMCDRGVVGPHVGSKARECMLTVEQWEELRAAEQGQGQPLPDDDDDDRPLVDESWE